MPILRRFIFLNATAYDVDATIRRLLEPPTTDASEECIRLLQEYAWTGHLDEFFPDLEIQQQELLVHTDIWLHDYGVEVDFGAALGLDDESVGTFEATGLSQGSDDGLLTQEVTEEERARIREASVALRDVFRRQSAHESPTSVMDILREEKDDG